MYIFRHNFSSGGHPSQINLSVVISPKTPLEKKTTRRIFSSGPLEKPYTEISPFPKLTSRRVVHRQGSQRGWCIRISATARAASLDDDDNDDDEEDRRRVRCSED